MMLVQAIAVITNAETTHTINTINILVFINDFFCGDKGTNFFSDEHEVFENSFCHVAKSFFI
jgi:hypothetical protein